MKVRIIQEPDGMYRIEKKTRFGWNFVCYAMDLEKARLKAERVLNPIIEEFTK